jgi:hypothetical protein
MLEMAQVTSASCKVLGSKNKVNVAEGMKRLLASYESIEQIAQRRGKTVAELNKNRYMIITGKESTATQRPEREHREKPQRPWGQQNTNKPFERRRFERTNTGAPVRPFSRPFNSRGTDPNRATDPTRGTDQNKPHQYSQNNNYNRFNAHNVKTPNPKNNNEVKS